ncbi:hypothetical protein TrRE_jg12178 [Triparma retinervis]|jgi:hypothetical protein|uniref:Uncharacterized protein n=1 Tax=Triparma retinervis TaxID=2557542 RepID=A0A9W6ZK93_9STRA|nr:hypothetical protein TrRE_jg12178 [Triparma retinervis]
MNRTQTAKLMLESSAFLASTGSPSALKSTLSNACIQVLGSLLSENDEVIETWFLLGCAFHALGPPARQQARFHFERALGMLEKAKKGMEEELKTEGGFDGGGLGEQIEDVEIQIDDVKDRIEDLGEEEGEDMEIG